MNRLILLSIFLTLMAAIPSGCGLLYDITQPAREHECYQLPKSQQQECLDRTMTFEEYKDTRKKEEDKKGGTP